MEPVDFSSWADFKIKSPHYPNYVATFKPTPDNIEDTIARLEKLMEILKKDCLDRKDKFDANERKHARIEKKKKAAERKKQREAAKALVSIDGASLVAQESSPPPPPAERASTGNGSDSGGSSQSGGNGAVLNVSSSGRPTRAKRNNGDGNGSNGNGGGGGGLTQDVSV